VPPLERTERGWLIDAAVTGVAMDSRKVQPGYIFVATPGHEYDGHEFAEEAIQRGAVAVVGERAELNLSVPYFQVESSRAEAARLASRFFHEPSRDLTVVGVTGTNGKTSVVFWLTHILRAAGLGTGLLSSVVNDLGGEKLPSNLTTAESPDLQQYLAKIRDFGYRHAVVEVSSQAIVQHRIDAVRFKMAILTNISREHLDFHHTMENYVAAKARLFSGLDRDSWGAVLNADDPYFNDVRRGVKAPVLTYGLSAGEVRAEVIDGQAWHSDLSIGWDGVQFDTRLNHPGRYNIYNLLAVVTAARALGVKANILAQVIPDLPAVPGRMHVIQHGASPTVIVDYAHTPDGLEQALTTVRDLRPHRLWLVLGARGGRDRGKRPEMGKIAAKRADRIVVTTDSPKFEDPANIAEEIIAGIRAVDGARLAGVVLDRAQAIRETILGAESGDVVLITGRGPETTQEFGHQSVPLVDSEVAEKAVREIEIGFHPGGQIEREQ